MISDMRNGRALARNFIFADLGEVVVGEPFVWSFGDGFHFGVRTEDNDHSGEFAAILVEVFFLFNVGADAFAGYDAVGTGGPCFRVDEKWDQVWGGHSGVDILIGPSATEGAPGFEVGIAQAHGGELVARPLIGALHVGRSGKAFADRIHEAGGEIHHFGIVEALIADAGDGFEINFFLGPKGGNK